MGGHFFQRTTPQSYDARVDAAGRPRGATEGDAEACTLEFCRRFTSARVPPARGGARRTPAR